MLLHLQNQLSLLHQSQRKQQKELEQLYLIFDQISNQQQCLQFPYKPKIDLFIYVRPEVIYQIMEFLDFESIQTLRLVSSNLNKIFKQTLPIQLANIKCHLQLQQTDLENYYQAQKEQLKEEAKCQEQFNLGLEEIKQVNRNTIAELKAFSRPPKIIGQIVYFLAVLLDFQPNKSTEDWRSNQRIFCCLNQFYAKLLTLRVAEITDKQLGNLQELENLDEQQVIACSVDFVKFFHYLKIVVEIRKTKLYEINHKIFVIQKQINQQKRQLIKLETMTE